MPSALLMSLANSFDVIRMLSVRSLPNTNSEDRINVAGIALAHRSMGAVLEELENVGKLAVEASQVTSFGDIPLLVITGTSPTRNDSIAVAFRDDFTRIWNELQQGLLSLSTNSQHILAPLSGHYIQLDQPDLVIDAIRSIIGPKGSE